MTVHILFLDQDDTWTFSSAAQIEEQLRSSYGNPWGSVPPAYVYYEDATETTKIDAIKDGCYIRIARQLSSEKTLVEKDIYRVINAACKKVLSVVKKQKKENYFEFNVPMETNDYIQDNDKVSPVYKIYVKADLEYRVKVNGVLFHSDFEFDNNLENVLYVPANHKGLIIGTGLELYEGVVYKTVTFDFGYKENDKQVTTSMSVEKGADISESLPTPSYRAGLSFVGWTADSTGVTPTDNFIINGDITYYAIWAADNITVYFNGNGGNWNDSSTIGRNIEIPQSMFPTVSRDRYELLGWSLNKNATEPDTSFALDPRDESGNPLSDVTLYAVWKQVQSLITFNYQNNGVTEPTTIVVATGENVWDDYQSKLPATPTYEGKTFVDWAFDVGGTNLVMESNAVFNGDTDLYAIWQDSTE